MGQLVKARKGEFPVIGGRYSAISSMGVSNFELFAFRTEINGQPMTDVAVDLGTNAIVHNLVFDKSVLNTDHSVENPTTIETYQRRRSITFLACCPDTEELEKIRETLILNKRLFESGGIHSRPQDILQPSLAELGRRGIPVHAAYIESN